MSLPRVLDRAALALSVLGLLVSAYLTYEHYTGSKTLACSESGRINCQAVTTSQYAALFGVPVALLGLLFFVAMVALSLEPVRERVPAADRIRLVSVIVGVVFVARLIWAEFYRINAICLWCTGVHVITVLLFGVLLFRAAWGTDEA